MKWLILLVLFAVLAVVILTRYRRQIQTVVYVWRMFRKMRQSGKSGEKQIEKKVSANENALIRCAKCGMWIPQESALKLRSKTFFCSANCMEKAVEVS